MIDLIGIRKKLNSAKIKNKETPEDGEDGLTVKDEKTVDFLNLRTIFIRHVEELLVFPKPKEIVFINVLRAFSAFDYVLFMLKQLGRIDRLFISTYNVSQNVVNALRSKFLEGVVQSVSITVNGKFSKSEADLVKYQPLINLQKQGKPVELRFDDNHSKIILIEKDNRFWCWSGSGNSAKNADKESYIWFESREVFDFYLDFLMK